MKKILEIKSIALFKENQYLKIFILLFPLLSLFILSIKNFVKYKYDYDLSVEKFYSLSSQEEIIKKKLMTLENSIKSQKLSLKKQKINFLSATYSSIPEVKIDIYNSTNNFNLSILNIYRIEKEEFTFNFDSELLIYKIGIPYELEGTLKELYDFLLYYNSYNKYILFNQHPFSIKFNAKNLLSIKFYVSTITAFPPN